MSTGPTSEPRTETACPEATSTALDPEHCAYCAAFVERQAAKKREPIVVKNECWDAARLKIKQLERELHSSSLTGPERADMLHTLSKLCMFVTDAWEQEVIRPAQRDNGRRR